MRRERERTLSIGFALGLAIGLAPFVAIGFALVLATCSFAHAQVGEDASEDFEIPPPPDSLPPQIVGEFHADLVFAFEDDHICPASAECVFGDGAGVGGTLWWRWPRGSALGIGYDIWFLDGNGVYELSSLQLFRVSYRKLLFPHRFLHPFIGASFGVEIFGDTFRADTFGAAIDFSVGAEVEITSFLSFTSALNVRLLSLTPFRSPSDEVRRADGFGVTGALALQFGLVLMPAPR